MSKISWQNYPQLYNLMQDKLSSSRPKCDIVNDILDSPLFPQELIEKYGRKALYQKIYCRPRVHGVYVIDHGPPPVPSDKETEPDTEVYEDSDSEMELEDVIRGMKLELEFKYREISSLKTTINGLQQENFELKEKNKELEARFLRDNEGTPCRDEFMPLKKIKKEIIILK